MRSAGLQEAAAVRVGVDVRDRMPLELRRVLLDPFGGPEQTLLFAIPRGVDDRPLRFPPLPEQRAQRPRLFELGGHAADGIVRAVHPCIVVIAADDPLVGIGGARDPGDHVVERLDVPRERDLQVDGRGARADVIRQRKPTSPVRWHERPAEGGQQRLRIPVRNRQHGNLRERLRILDIQPLRVSGGADAQG